jgi:hypothetical protein
MLNRSGVAALFLGLLSSFSTASASEKKKDAVSEIEKIEFVNVLVGDKKVWQPSDAKLTQGKKYEIVLKNTLSEPHGFEVPGLTEPLVVFANESKTVIVSPTKAGTFPFKCQLHPAHVGGTLTVQ